jgi:hypothetical protein
MDIVAMTENYPTPFNWTEATTLTRQWRRSVDPYRAPCNHKTGLRTVGNNLYCRQCGRLAGFVRAPGRT